MVKKIFLSLLVLFVLSSASAVYFYFQLRTIKNNPLAVADQENSQLVEAVSKLMLLPDEKPTIATVTDPAKLSDQQFFANAKTGYKVLVFSVAKKAILYDPVSNKIIEVGPVKVTEEDSAARAKTE